jgi:hypothetical protein
MEALRRQQVKITKIAPTLNIKLRFKKYLQKDRFWLPAILSLTLILSLVGLSAASTIQFSLAHNATSNIFQSYQAYADQLTSAGLSFGGDSQGLALYGSMDLNYLYKYSGLSSFSGKLGADILAPAGSRSAFYFALEGEAVLFRSLYDYFNHSTIRFLANFKSYLTPSTIFRLDSESRLNNYKYAIFDYFSESLTMSINNFFKTRTTIMVEASYGYKLYFHPGIITANSSEETYIGGLTKSELSSLAFSSIKGGKALTPPPFQGGPGAGTGNPSDNYMRGGWYSIRGVPYQPVYYTGSRSLQIFSVSGLLAQGLGENLGLSLSASRQWYLKGENPFSSSDEYFMVENPTYDRFAWEGYSLRAKLSAVITARLTGEIQYDYFSRQFPGIISLNLEGNSLGITRKDIRHQFSTRLQLDLARVSFFLNYSYLKNSSNDPWFSWDGNVFSVGLAWNLNVSPSK